MAHNGIKLGHTVTSVKTFASLVPLIFLPKNLTWNKMVLLAFLELVVNEGNKRIFKNISSIPLSIRVITV